MQENKSNNKINNKTISRIAAIQTMYQYQQEDPAPDINVLMQNMLAFYQDGDLHSDHESTSKNPIKIRPSINHFSELIKFTIPNLEELDQIIATHLATEWEINDLQPLLLAVLRVAASELKFFPETPQKVIVNEFTDIASDMLTDNEIGFVNSILDKIAKTMRI